jgi:hypothetical protein
MKKIYTFFLVISGLFSTLFTNAQTNVTSSGLSVQGIARDGNNEALANIDQLDLKFEVYYFIGASTTPTNILSSTATIKTDNFGVFSYVVGINQDQANLISTQSAYLRVSSVTTGNVIFSDEKLQTVPYSIYAQNGVPTGSIMPYIGTTAPNGWLLCNGNQIPSGSYYDNLKALAGNNTPNLNGMFLRGAGSQTAYPSNVGPAVKVVQPDDNKSHLHAIDFNTTQNGSHSHTTTFSNDNYSGTGGGSSGLEDDRPNEQADKTLTTSSDGGHTHNVRGNTANTGGTETRPINYGVNYIIKI